MITLNSMHIASLSIEIEKNINQTVLDRFQLEGVERKKCLYTPLFVIMAYLQSTYLHLNLMVFVYAIEVYISYFDEF